MNEWWGHRLKTTGDASARLILAPDAGYVRQIGSKERVLEPSDGPLPDPKQQLEDLPAKSIAIVTAWLDEHSPYKSPEESPDENPSDEVSPDENPDEWADDEDQNVAPAEDWDPDYIWVYHFFSEGVTLSRAAFRSKGEVFEPIGLGVEAVVMGDLQRALAREWLKVIPNNLRKTKVGVDFPPRFIIGYDTRDKTFKTSTDWEEERVTHPVLDSSSVWEHWLKRLQDKGDDSAVHVLPAEASQYPDEDPKCIIM
jgi:hypothetical protein